MYTQQMDKVKKRQDNLNAKLGDSQPKVAKMDAKKIEASVHRLHEQSLKHREETMRRLNGQVVSSKAEARKLDRSERERVNKGLYYERVETEKVRKARLMDKYLQGQVWKVLASPRSKRFLEDAPHLTFENSF